MRYFTGGSMILEVIIGFGISMVALTAILQLSNRSVGNSGFAVRESQAGRYADEAADWLKAKANEVGWSGVVNYAADVDDVPDDENVIPHEIYCANELVWPPVTVCGGASVIHNTEYVRGLELWQESVGTGTVIKALVRVQWAEADRTAEVVRLVEIVGS